MSDGWTVCSSVAEHGEGLRRAPVALEVDAAPADGFWSRVRTFDVNRVHIAEAFAAGHRVKRTQRLIRAAHHPVLHTNLLVAGSALLRQGDVCRSISAGNLVVLDATRPYALEFEGMTQMIVLMHRPAALGLPAEMIDDTAAHTFTGEAGVEAIVTSHLRGMVRCLDGVGGVVSVRLVQTALDLIATMLLDRMGDGAAALGAHDLLFRRICRFIDRELGRPELGPAQIAEAHFISTRSLYDLFRRRGSTVSAWVRRRRLDRCRRELEDPLHAHHPVAAIATRSGFVDAAHFSRAFKAEYGVSPTTVREEAARRAIRSSEDPGRFPRDSHRATGS